MIKQWHMTIFFSLLLFFVNELNNFWYELLKFALVFSEQVLGDKCFIFFIIKEWLSYWVCFLSSKVIISTFVIFLGSGVPVSSTSTFWYTFGELSHLVRSPPLRRSDFFQTLKIKCFVRDRENIFRFTMLKIFNIIIKI